MSPTASPRADAEALADSMVSLRRELHQRPEVGLDLPVTSELVRKALEDLGLDVESDAASSGLTARMPGTSGHTVILRADMDALPIGERTDLEFRSLQPGAMHACGHDMHTAMLVTAARALAHVDRRHDVVFAFQAGEEFDRGAVPLLKHRHLREVGDARTFALHMHAQKPAGTFLGRSGPFMAFGDWFDMRITGKSGHASAPHLARSPIGAAAFLAAQIDGLTDLSEEPWPTRVATVTQVTAGNSVNIIPDAALLRGTLRGRDVETIEGLRQSLSIFAAQAQERFPVDVELEITVGYPSVVNDPDMADYAEYVARQLLRAPVERMSQPSMVIEDYSYFLQKWPGAMTYLGAKVEGGTSFNHSADVVFDESAMVDGCAFLIALGTDGA